MTSSQRHSRNAVGNNGEPRGARLPTAILPGSHRRRRRDNRTIRSGAPSSSSSRNGRRQPRFRSGERNGIPPDRRRSIEDECRPLPGGWVRRFDPDTQHQFFVDTRADPPRSIWTHPLDDRDYLASLSPAERARAEEEDGRWFQHHFGGESDDDEGGGGIRRRFTGDDIVAETTDSDNSDADDQHRHRRRQQGAAGASSSAKPTAQAKSQRGFGCRLKDRLTGTTHEQREAARRKREEEERELYRQHMAFRGGLLAAIRDDRPQLLGHDTSGRPVYLEPPGNGYAGVSGVTRLSPRVTEVHYRPGAGPLPDELARGARFVRPEGYAGPGLSAGGVMYPGGAARYYGRPMGSYARPCGMGYGGGMGLPFMAPLFGGMMLGGLML
ncbi:hypothetical protein DL766_006960 [Monosporascus sp. MC13-8B]|nr:hypothetical protein DL763_009119 [Monosporascus cannonballus]RYP25635.1 hypothetical protein DL766_006960 [Monosporascus sp. MC13-8B]